MYVSSIMSAPVISIDSAGMLTWSADVAPNIWVIDQCLADGTTLTAYNRTIFLGGDATSYDASSLPKGLYMRLCGADGEINLILLPSISATPLTY
jgi:hypothetical protein